MSLSNGFTGFLKSWHMLTMFCLSFVHACFPLSFLIDLTFSSPCLTEGRIMLPFVLSLHYVSFYVFKEKLF